MFRIFTPDSPFKKQARSLAILWTLLIFIGCFTPGKDIPKVEVPFIDKWVHLVMFGGFTILWLCSKPVRTFSGYLKMFLIAVALGSFIELMQGLLSFLGRSMELMDAVADSIGGLSGIGVFGVCAYFAEKKSGRF
jgi:VanZ family protein